MGALAREGAKVTITGRRKEVLEEAASALGVDAIVADVGVEADAVRTVAEVVDRHGRLDLLVNNAGIGSGGALVDLELAELERVYRTNVFGAFLMAREAARVFVKQSSGNLVNVSSTSGLKGGRGSTAYSSSRSNMLRVRGFGSAVISLAGLTKSTSFRLRKAKRFSRRKSMRTRRAPWRTNRAAMSTETSTNSTKPSLITRPLSD